MDLIRAGVGLRYSSCCLIPVFAFLKRPKVKTEHKQIKNEKNYKHNRNNDVAGSDIVCPD